MSQLRFPINHRLLLCEKSVLNICLLLNCGREKRSKKKNFCSLIEYEWWNISGIFLAQTLVVEASRVFVSSFINTSSSSLIKRKRKAHISGCLFFESGKRRTKIC